MEEHPIQGLMTTTMENLKDMIDVNTIIGDPVESPDGSVIIPVSKLGFGFAAGGSEFKGSSDSSDSDSVLPFGGGSGGGVSVTPIAFLIVNGKGVKMVHLDENVHIYEKIIDFAPKAVEKIEQMLKESFGNQNSNKSSEEKGKFKKLKRAKLSDDEDQNYMI
ncbi:GerW family sporulation protein [Virgibacillus soli]|uniref:GerW family sporulation protein n=1 Tax=Paracerasibacillus soli TaxID=480284 RepID=A0ABU5CS18_9BACI|nr:GerW family sporulation protein [Virgibacillus soli]MDY0408671.1 GerW family sporulation protein [Virgibacillus soli]